MSPTCTLSLALGCIMALSSCSVFKKDDPAPAENPYAAANPYATGAAGTQNQGYPAYGNTGAANTGGYDPGNPYGQPAAGSYAPPTYSQPPAGSYPPAAGAGYGGTGYSGAAAGSTGGNYGAASGSGRTHQVAAGENLTKISRRYSVSVDALMRANNLSTDLIRQGQTLNIP